MNGKQAKHLRRAANLLDRRPLSYGIKQQRKKGMFPELNDKGELIKRVEKDFMAESVIVVNCHRAVYQAMKEHHFKVIRGRV